MVSGAARMRMALDNNLTNNRSQAQIWCKDVTDLLLQVIYMHGIFFSWKNLSIKSKYLTNYIIRGFWLIHDILKKSWKLKFISLSYEKLHVETDMTESLDAQN